MLLQRIEIHRVAGAEPELIDADDHFQFALDEVEQLDTGMEVRYDFLRR